MMGTTGRHDGTSHHPGPQYTTAMDHLDLYLELLSDQILDVGVVRSGPEASSALAAGKNLIGATSRRSDPSSAALRPEGDGG